MKKLPRFTMITGPRRSGKTYRALKMAREYGRPFGVLVGCDEPALFYGAVNDVGGQYAGAHVLSFDVQRLAEAKVSLVVVDDAHLVDRSRWDEIFSLWADFIIVSAPVISQRSSPWLDVVAGAHRICMNPANAELDSEGWARLNKIQEIVSGADAGAVR